jgi:hypothetical protein
MWGKKKQNNHYSHVSRPLPPGWSSMGEFKLLAGDSVSIKDANNKLLVQIEALGTAHLNIVERGTWAELDGPVVCLCDLEEDDAE